MLEGVLKMRYDDRRQQWKLILHPTYMIMNYVEVLRTNKYSEIVRVAI